MKYTETGTYGDTTEILYNDEYVADRKVLDFTGNKNGVFLAGTPIGADGKVAVDSGSPAVSNAIGILLSDTYADDPNAALVIFGFIDTAKAEAHSGVTISDTVKAALKLVDFR